MFLLKDFIISFEISLSLSEESTAITKKQSNLLFLGGFYDNKIINKVFLKNTLSVKSSIEVYSDLISTITLSQSALINSLQKVPNNLVHCIQSVDSSNNI